MAEIADITTMVLLMTEHEMADKNKRDKGKRENGQAALGD